MLESDCPAIEAQCVAYLDSLYAFYPHQWRCYSHMYRVFKFRQALLNRVVLLVVAAGMIAGSIFENTILVSCLTAWGTVLKGWSNFKKFHHHVCQEAWGIPFEEDSTLIRMQTFNVTITYFSPPISDECTQKYHHFYYVSLEGLPSMDGCPRPPMLNALHGPLKEDAQPLGVQWWCLYAVVERKKLRPFGLIMKKNSSTLDGLFLDEDSPYTLSGNEEELLGAARTLGVPQQSAQTYLCSVPTFTLHRLQHQCFPRSKTVVGPSVDHTWQADLVEMQDPKLVQNNRRMC